MRKTIEIDGRGVPFAASAATPRLYRQFTGGDIFTELKAFSGKEPGNYGADELETLENLAFVMAKQADPAGVPDTAAEWLDGFEMFSVYGILPEVMELWAENVTSVSDAKKKQPRQPASLTRRFSF